MMLRTQDGQDPHAAGGRVHASMCVMAPHPIDWKGFTLVELLVVMAVISILAGLLLPALQRAVGNARQTACAAQMKQVGAGFSLYVDGFGGYAPQYMWRNDPALPCDGGTMQINFWDKCICYYALGIEAVDSRWWQTCPRHGLDGGGLRPDILHCPSMIVKERGSYLYNREVPGDWNNVTRKWESAVHDMVGAHSGGPSRVAVMFEGQRADQIVNYNWGYMYANGDPANNLATWEHRHPEGQIYGSGMNILFADLHVNYEKANTNPLTRRVWEVYDVIYRRNHSP